ncbi:MAG: hypothetical protein IPL91_14600 [Hyphomicrobium sp.]|nr:hypothetical protein [Hyphomicrobium sp.]
MSSHEIPTSPANYEIWTVHRLGGNPALSMEIEARLAKAERFTTEVNEELFERFFSNTRLSMQVMEASNGIARESTEAVATLREAGEQSGSYAKTRKRPLQLSRAASTPRACAALVTELTAAARDMADQNLQMSEQMKASSR